MSTQLKLRRGNTAQHLSFTGALAEITVDTDKNTIVVHDGITPGGHSLSIDTKSQAAFDKANAAGTQTQTQAAFNQANTAYNTSQLVFNFETTTSDLEQATITSKPMSKNGSTTIFESGTNISVNVTGASTLDVTYLSISISKKASSVPSSNTAIFNASFAQPADGSQLPPTSKNNFAFYNVIPDDQEPLPNLHHALASRSYVNRF